MQTINFAANARDKIFNLRRTINVYGVIFSTLEKLLRDNNIDFGSTRALDNLTPELKTQLIYKIIQSSNASPIEREFLDKYYHNDDPKYSIIIYNSKYQLSQFTSKLVESLSENDNDRVKRSDLIATLFIYESFRTNKNKIIYSINEDELRNKALLELMLKERVPYISGISTNHMEEEYLTYILNCNEYHVISRMKILSPTELAEKYGEKLAFKISKYIWYISDIGYILIPYPHYAGYSSINNVSFYESIKKYGSLQFEKYIESRNNLDYFLTPFSEEFKDFIYQIAYNNSEEEVANKICDYLKTSIEEQDNYYKQLYLVQSKELLTAGRLYNNNFTSNFLANCKRLSSSIIKYSNEKYANRLDISKQIMLATINEDSVTKLNVTKGIAILEREMNRTDNLKYVLNYEMNRDILKIYTGWVPALYVDKTQLAAYLASGYNGSKRRKQYLEGYINGENMIWTAPIDIAIKFSDKIYHGLKYDRFHQNNYIDVNHSLENCHQHYGSEESSGCGSTGCTGTFNIGFTDAGATYNIPKMIALQLQYIQTIVPFDWAGNQSIDYCIITDNNNKIVDACDQSLIGKYIDNSNPNNFYISVNGKEE